MAKSFDNPSTGVLDSVAISYDDLRIVNSKLIELNYEKQINSNLKLMFHNDSIMLNNAYANIDLINKKCNKIKRQRNIFGSIAIIGVITSLIFILK